MSGVPSRISVPLVLLRGCSSWCGCVDGQMDPVAVLDALKAINHTPEALQDVGQHIISAAVVGVDDLVAAGLSGRAIIAVRRAMDPSVSGA